MDEDEAHGLLRRPAAGPATPVTASPTSAPSRSRTPRAIAAAASAETAPCSRRRSPRRRAVPPSRSRRTPRRRRDRRRSRPARSSAALLPAHRCRTRPWRASSPSARQRASTMLLDRPFVLREDVPPVLRPERAEERLRPRLRAGLRERVDVDLEVAGADGHVEAIAVAARLVQRPGDRRLAHAVERSVLRSRWRARSSTARTGASVQRGRPQPLELARGAREHDHGRALCLSTNPGAVPARPMEIAPSGSVACFRTPCAKSAYGLPRRSANDRETASISASRPLSTTRLDVGGPCDHLHRAVVVCRSQPPGHDAEVGRNASRRAASSSRGASPTIVMRAGSRPSAARRARGTARCGRGGLLARARSRWQRSPRVAAS